MSKKNPPTTAHTRQINAGTRLVQVTYFKTGKATTVQDMWLHIQGSGVAFDCILTTAEATALKGILEDSLTEIWAQNTAAPGEAAKQMKRSLAAFNRSNACIARPQTGGRK